MIHEERQLDWLISPDWRESCVTRAFGSGAREQSWTHLLGRKASQKPRSHVSNTSFNLSRFIVWSRIALTRKLLMPFICSSKVVCLPFFTTVPLMSAHNRDSSCQAASKPNQAQRTEMSDRTGGPERMGRSLLSAGTSRMGGAASTRRPCLVRRTCRAALCTPARCPQQPLDVCQFSGKIWSAHIISESALVANAVTMLSLMY
jgi:hypothetical protein